MNVDDSIERQLAEAQGKLDAVKAWRWRFGAESPLARWRELDRILKEE